MDLETGTLTVRRALQRVNRQGLLLAEPFAGRRTLVLPDPLREALHRHAAWQHEQRAAAANAWMDGPEFVFAQPNGRPIGARRDWKARKRLLQPAGVRDARLHDARHTAATLLLQQGVAPRVAIADLHDHALHARGS